MPRKSLESTVHSWCVSTTLEGKRPTGALAMHELRLSPSTAYRHVRSWLEKQGNVPQPAEATNSTVEAEASA